MTIPFSISENYQARYPGLSFGFTLIADCQNPINPPNFDEYKRTLLRQMRKRETLARITERITLYDRFFISFGHECPLPKHLKRTVNSGFPRYNLMVDTHFMAEMCAGILVAVTDYDRFDGALTLDIARDGETCRGMGERKLITREGEIVLRDEQEIVCVLCQGADEKTRVNESTSRVLFYAYAVPGIEARYLKAGLDLAAETMTRFGQGTVEAIDVY
ncbi:MAG: phenylalanine--tRNA ligase beta subunit-related protein [Thermodesulfobacteriota bacterium]